MRSGEGTVMSVGPYDVIVQGDSLDQFDNKRANESVKESINCIESEKPSLKSTGLVPYCVRVSQKAARKGNEKTSTVNEPKLMKQRSSKFKGR